MAKLGELTVIRATENKAIKFFICGPLEKQDYNITKIKFLARVKILRADSNAMGLRLVPAVALVDQEFTP
jgi:hypothetical protein